MFLHGGYLGIHVPQKYRSVSHLPQKHIKENEHKSHQPRSESALLMESFMLSILEPDNCLEYDPDGCHPAYTRLRIIDRHAFMRYCGEDTNCIEESGGHHWLNTRRLNEKLQELFNSHRLSAFERTTGISGPAGQADGGLTDIVPTLIGSAPLNAIDSYVLRSRSSWPSQIQLQEVKHLPMCSVLVGHQKSPMGARVSSSPGELILISKLSKSIKQGYIAAKYTLKHFLKKYRQQSETDDGRSHVGSYHLKTTLLYYLEKNPPHQIRSSFGMMKDLLQDLNIYVISRHLPNYFLSECNLLDTVGPDQLVIARKAICDILLDPVAAVLKCPSMPNQIYGDISPDDLVKAFRQVAARPSHEQGWEDLLRLLSCLDGS